MNAGRIIILFNLLCLYQSGLFAQSYHARIPGIKCSSQATQITIPVLISENLTGQEIYAYTLHLSWDNKIVQNPVANLTDCLAEDWGSENLLQNSPAADQLIISHHAASPALSGSGTLLKLNFQLAGKAGSGCQVRIDLLVLNTVKAITTPGKIIVNNPPSASNLIINPENPRTADDLNLNYLFTDPDNDPEDSTLIQWYKNGKQQLTYNQQLKIPASITQKAERWSFTIKPNDGIELGKTVQSAEVTIQNTPPTVQNLKITPIGPVNSNTLHANYQFFDEDGDLEQGTEIKWYQNDKINTTFLNTLTVPPTALKTGDSWYFTIRPRDGETYGQEQKSPVVIIGISNHPPEVKNLSISPAAPRTDETLVGAYQYSDFENDPEKNSEIDWYKNNIIQPELKNQRQVPPSLTTKNEEWYFTVKPSDGKDFGTKTNSPVVQIQNSVPVASNLQLMPASPTVQDSLFAAYQYTDADQDLESGSQIRWYKNGSLQSSYNNLKSIPSSELTINDSWHFTIEPGDGTIKGKIVASKTLVIQGVPMLVNFSAAPSSGKEPLRVQFQDLSHGTIKTWLWDLGDGQTSSEQNPVHIYYARQSPYTVKLIVNDASGQDSLTMKNLITVFSSLQAHFSAAPISGKPGLEVQFQNETEGAAQILKWFWGDGTYSTYFASHIIFTHIYKNPGCYSVALKASGKSVTDSVCYKDLIYIHNNIIPLKCIGSGNGLKGTSWENIIDQDVFTDSGIVIANLRDAWAIFQFSDGIIRKLTDLRIKRANYFSNSSSGRLTKKFEVFVTPEVELGDNLKQVLEADLTSNEWQIFSFPNDTRARYVEIKILAAEDASQDTCELAEFQLFGIPDEAVIGTESGSHSKYPLITNLTPNYPNPFNPETRIQYQLAEEGMVSISIYNLHGELICKLIQESQKAGNYEIRWDGKDNYGAPVSSGIYLCRFQFINKSQKVVIQTQKLTLIK